MIFIKEKNEFKQSTIIINDVINKGNNLPNNVFNKRFTYYFFNQFDWAMSPDIWEEIKKISTLTKDNHILMAVLDPDPVTYYKRNFDYYNWAKLPISCSADEYMALLSLEPPDSPADAVIFNSEIIVWLPPSKKWAIFGNKDRNLCVLGTNKRNFSSEEWHTLDYWKDDLSLEFSKKQELDQFIQQMKRNYLQINH